MAPHWIYFSIGEQYGVRVKIFTHVNLLSFLTAREKMMANIAEIFSGYQDTLEAEQELREVSSALIIHILIE